MNARAPASTAAKLFLWGSVAAAVLTFVGALAAGISVAGKIRGAEGDDARYEVLLEEAREKFDNGDFVNAKALTLRLLEINPADPIARSNLGRIDKGQGDYAAAIAEHKLAIAQAPDLPDLYYNVACYYALLKKKDDSLTWLAAAFAHGFGRMDVLRGDRDLDFLKGDPRFELASRTGKFPDGTPVVRFHAVSPTAKTGEAFELVLVVEREVAETDAAAAARELTVEWAPEAPLALVSKDERTVADSKDGVVTLRTTARYVVRASKAGIYAVPPAKITAGSKKSESPSLEVEIKKADR